MDPDSMMNFLKTKMETAEETKRLNRSKPMPRPHRDPFQERMRWQIMVMHEKMRNEKKEEGTIETKTTILSSELNFNILLTFINIFLGDSHSCKIPFEELTPIKLRDLQVPKVHVGRYLVCQVISAPSQIVGVSALIQDLDGKQL